MSPQTEFWLTVVPVLAINAYVLTGIVIFALISRRRPKTAEIENRHFSPILGKWIREFWFWITKPVMDFLLWSKVTPNMLSFLGTVIAAFSMLAFAGQYLGLGGWLMIMAACLDLFDGRVARETGQISESGAYFDSTMDRISESLTFAGIVFMYRDSPIFWLAILALTGSQLTSYTRCKGEAMQIHYSGGMMQRPERITYLGASAVLIPMILMGLARIWPDYFVDIRQLGLFVYAIPLAFVAVLSNAAAINRIRHIMRHLSDKDRAAGTR